MSYRCGIGPGIPGLEPGPPRITCDACGRVLTIDQRKLPPKWLFDGKAPPKWTLVRTSEPFKRLDICPDHTLETLLAERDDARAIARALAFLYEHEAVPGVHYQKLVAAGLAYPAIPHKAR